MNRILVIWLMLLSGVVLYGDWYLLETRPRIDTVIDYPVKGDDIHPRFVSDGNGFDYPMLKIYHRDFWLNDTWNLPWFEVHRSYWEGRITDMGSFLTNHGASVTNCKDKQIFLSP